MTDWAARLIKKPQKKCATMFSSRTAASRNGFPKHTTSSSSRRRQGFETEEKERHPLLQQAMDLLVRFDDVFGDADPRCCSFALGHALSRRR